MTGGQASEKRLPVRQSSLGPYWTQQQANINDGYLGADVCDKMCQLYTIVTDELNTSETGDKQPTPTCDKTLLIQFYQDMCVYVLHEQ